MVGLQWPAASARRAAAALFLALFGDGAQAIRLTRGNIESTSTATFRTFSVPYRLVKASHTEVTDLPAELSKGDLLAYEPWNPASGDLFVFLAGTSSTCHDYTQLLESVGKKIVTVCLPYDNLRAIGELCAGNRTCYKELRVAAFKGSFDNVTGNNIEARLTGALQYLAKNDHGNWSRYLDSTLAAPSYPRIRMGGHSQGAGTAALVGYLKPLARVVQFAGVCDRSDWTARLGPPMTHSTKFFGLASRWDTYCDTFRAQVASWRSEGALKSTSQPLKLHAMDKVTVKSMGAARVAIADLLPFGCTEAIKNQTCARWSHAIVAKNWPNGTSPFANGIWQSLVGV